MFRSIRGKFLVLLKLSKVANSTASAFWGQSFVAELTRISAHGEKKLRLRRASLAQSKSKPEVQREIQSEVAGANGESVQKVDETVESEVDAVKPDA